MMIFRHALFLFFACTCVWANCVFAQEENDEVFEAYVELFMPFEHDSFYRVMQNVSEEPYLELETFAKQWLQLEGGCRNQICLFYQPKDVKEQHKPYRLDLKQKQCTLPDNNSDLTIDLVYSEEKAWLHWSSFVDCFPVTILWNLDRYSLKVKLHYSTYQELEKKLAQRRAIAKQKADELEAQKAQPRILPSSVTSASARVKGRAEYFSDANPEYSVRTDAYLVHQDASFEVSYDTQTPDEVDFYQLEISPFPLGYQFQMGHVVLDSGLASNSDTYEDGIYYSRLKPKTQSGSLVIEEQTLPNTFVDVYVNDVYRGTVKSDASGRYSISDFPLSAGDQVELHEMVRSGVVERKSIKVADIDETLLNQGQWNLEFGASLTDDKTGKGQISYGLTDSLTAVGSLYKGETENSGGFGMRWLPVHFLSIEFEWLPRQSIAPLTLEMAVGESHKLEADINHIDMLGEDPLKREHNVRYRYLGSPISFNLDANYDEYELTVIPQLRAQTASSQFLTLELKNRRTPVLIRDELSLKYAIHTHDYGSVNLSSIFADEASPRYRVGYRYLCSNCFFSGWWQTLQSTYSAQATWTNQKLGYSGNARWEFSQNWSGEVAFTDESISVALETKWGGRVIADDEATKTSQLPWEEFIYAELTGRVLDNHDQPVPNVKLKVNNKRATTDSEGYFRFTHVGYGEDLQLHVDESSLDLNLKPEENPIYFHAEKGGKTHIEVRVNKSFGVDGIVTAPDSFAGWHLNFFHEESGKSYSARVEQDGFYFIEDLVPGDYRIVLEDNEIEIENRVRILSEEWISGLNFVVYKLHKRAKPVLQVVYQP
ncbi:carboxypeptidase-like regulatory domain-containing protein [Vibrio nigripulchritudo]|uniref:carboxypeptidase-like regulatory domain-containing protein n=1 Tax=Vibrio nigripulchritudo TaxID=28173 RepID=UPI0024938CF7|nr:carboxypeptidase-like regulatory domain-containing protein [Vibrio nigripulchritudo]